MEVKLIYIWLLSAIVIGCKQNVTIDNIDNICELINSRNDTIELGEDTLLVRERSGSNNFELIVKSKIEGFYFERYLDQEKFKLWIRKHDILEKKSTQIERGSILFQNQCSYCHDIDISMDQWPSLVKKESLKEINCKENRLLFLEADFLHTKFMCLDSNHIQDLTFFIQSERK